VTNAYRRIPRLAALATMAFVATLVVGSTPASAAGFTGGLSPTVFGGRLDINGSGGIGGRDDSNAFYGQTDVIDGGIDCDTWGATPNAGTSGSSAIDASDDCTLIGVDGSVDGATILVMDGAVATVDGVAVTDGYVMPAIFNADRPFDSDATHADFGWRALGGRVDVNLSGAIDDLDCARGIVGETDDEGLGAPSDGADVLGASPACANDVAQTSAVDGLVDLNSDGRITNADTCADACFLGQNVEAGSLGGLPGPTIASFTPATGPAGTSVTIAGTNLGGATEVRFNGTAAAIVSNTGTMLAVTVPAGATTGPIAVATPNGETTSAAAFTVTTTPPGGPHQRTLTLELRRHLVALGAVTVADGETGCAVGAEVRVQKKIGKRWRTIQAAQTRRNMTYVAVLPNLPGKYRTYAPNSTLGDGDRCASATSPIVRR
jgi:hypothetical protein